MSRRPSAWYDVVTRLLAGETVEVTLGRLTAGEVRDLVAQHLDGRTRHLGRRFRVRSRATERCPTCGQRTEREHTTLWVEEVRLGEVR